MMKFFDMGGYAIYLWPAYALTLVVLGLNIVWARRSLRRAQADARRRLTRARSMERIGPAERMNSVGHIGPGGSMEPRS